MIEEKMEHFMQWDAVEETSALLDDSVPDKSYARQEGKMTRNECRLVERSVRCSGNSREYRSEEGRWLGSYIGLGIDCPEDFRVFLSPSKHIQGLCHFLQNPLQLSIICHHAVWRYTWSSYWLTYLRVAECFLRSHQSLSYSRTSQHFMDPEGWLPCSEEPSTSPYPEADQWYHLILSQNIF
jgi:hypothetical protein